MHVTELDLYHCTHVDTFRGQEASDKTYHTDKQ